MRVDLNGKVALVTGGSGGLGQRICHALTDDGANVAVIYNESRDLATEFAGTLEAKGVEAQAFQCDVADHASVESMAQAVLDRFGRVDVLINDAAYNKWIPFNDLDALTYEEWDKILTINLNGPMYTIKAVAPTMKKQGGGRIVNISSVAGIGPTGSSIAYAVSKAGLNHLTRCMAVGLAPDILVNTVAPGFLEGTRMSNNLAPEYQQAAKDLALLKRAADKDDVAAQVLGFCRTDSITGQTIVVDSGRVFN